jgi:hypothetical protein
VPYTSNINEPKNEVQPSNSSSNSLLSALLALPAFLVNRNELIHTLGRSHFADDIERNILQPPEPDAGVSVP